MSEQDKDSYPVATSASEGQLERARAMRSRLMSRAEVSGEDPLTTDPEIVQIVARKRLAQRLWSLLLGMSAGWVLIGLTNGELWYLVPLGLIVGGGVFDKARDATRALWALRETLDEGVTCPARVVGHRQRTDTPEIVLEFDCGGETHRKRATITNPDVTHPVGTTIWIVFDPASGEVFIPDEEGVSLHVRALPEPETPSEAEDQATYSQQPIFSDRPDATVLWPQPALLSAGWRGRAGSVTVSVLESALQVEGGDQDLQFDLDDVLSVTMGRAEPGDLLVTLRQEANTGHWIEWQFAVNADEYAEHADVDVSRLPAQAVPPGVSPMSAVDAVALLGHVHALEH